MASPRKTEPAPEGGLLGQPDVWTLISELYWMSYKLLERRLYHLGISASQARVVAILHAEGAAMRPSAIATILFQETQSITGILNRMEDHGWIQRKPDMTDRRAVSVELTEKGREMADEIRATSADLYRELIGGALSAPERRAVEQALKKVRAHGFQMSETDFRLRRARVHPIWSE